MKFFNLNQNQFSDFINLSNNVFYPLVNFVNKNEFNLILKRKIFNKKFFPFPIFFGLSREQFKKIKKNNELDLVYKSKKITKINKLNLKVSHFTHYKLD